MKFGNSVVAKVGQSVGAEVGNSVGADVGDSVGAEVVNSDGAEVVNYVIVVNSVSANVSSMRRRPERLPAMAKRALPM